MYPFIPIPRPSFLADRLPSPCREDMTTTDSIQTSTSEETTTAVTTSASEEMTTNVMTSASEETTTTVMTSASKERTTADVTSSTCSCRCTFPDRTSNVTKMEMQRLVQVGCMTKQRFLLCRDWAGGRSCETLSPKI